MKPMSASEMYDKIGGRLKAPCCECHGEPMWWHGSFNRPKGGWRCAVTERERSQLRYWKDPIGAAAKQEKRRRGIRIEDKEAQLKLLEAQLKEIFDSISKTESQQKG